MTHGSLPAAMLVSLLMALALVASACGGDDGDTATATATTDAGTDAPDDEAELPENRDTEPATPAAEATSPTETYTVDAEPEERPGETLELRFASYIGESAPQSQTMQWWSDEVSRRTDGMVTVEHFYAQALLPATEILPGVGSGRADAGYTANAYHPAELPLTSVVEIPFLTSNAAAQALALQELYETNDAFRREWNDQGVHVLFFPALSGNILGSKEPVSGLADIEGKSIRGLGLINDALSAVGANPVAIPAPDIYESLQRGVIDGYSGFAFEVVTALNLQEVAPNIVGTGMGQYVTPAIVITKSEYDALPADARAEVDEVSAEALDRSIQLLKETETEVCTTILDGGGTVSMLPDEDISRWEDQVASQLREQWISDHAGTSVPAEEFLNTYENLVETYEAEVEYVPGVQDCAAQ